VKNHNTTPAERTQALLDRARRYCALSEQCESGVRQKLIAWGAATTDIDPIVRQLRSDSYLDDERYARAYCESKLLHQSWSRQKVLYQLRLKRLPKEAIDNGMAAVDEEAYLDQLRATAAHKLQELGGPDDPDADRRLTTFLLGRGFTMDEINQATNNR